MAARVGVVVMTCPACGSAFEVPVQVANVRVDEFRLLVHFRDRFVDHACQGRH